MNFELRLASNEDVDEILNLYNQLIDEMDKDINYPKWTRDFYPNRAYLVDKTRVKELFVLTYNNDIIGSAVLNTERIPDYNLIPWTQENIPDDRILTIHTFAIKDELRGQHLGKEFIQLIEDYARQNGFKSIRLDTIYGNIPAVHFYENAGYKNLGQHTLHYDETDETRFVLFEKDL